MAMTRSSLLPTFSSVCGGEWTGPECRAGRRCCCIAAVHGDAALCIAADAVAPTDDVEHSGPAVRVQRNGLAGLHDGIEHADDFVFEQDAVKAWCGEHCVQADRSLAGTCARFYASFARR